MLTPAIGTRELQAQLQVLIDSDTPVFIHGSPGIGKSDIVGALARQNDLELVDVRLSQLDAVDLRGIPAISNHQTRWMPPVFLPTDSHARGILFLDELNSAPLSVQAAIYQLVLDRRIGEYCLPGGFRIVCAGNRIDDKGIVFKLPSPLINRMVHVVLEARYEDFKIWALHAGVHPSIIGFLGFRPDLLSSPMPAASESNPAFCTPRSWTMLSGILKHCADLSTIRPIVHGAVGYAAGIEFLSFVEIYQRLPDVTAILEGRQSTAPDDPGTLYALTAALVEHYAHHDHARHLFAYCDRLPVEFAVMLIKDLIVKDESICELAQFEHWLEAHGEYIL